MILMTNMNSRIRRRFKAMGFNASSPKDESGKFTDYEGYVAPSKEQKHQEFIPVTQSAISNQKDIIRQAKNMYLGGKHLGSKPLKTIKNRIRGVSELVGTRRAYIKAIQEAQEALKAQKAEETKEENVEEVTAENVD